MLSDSLLSEFETLQVKHESLRVRSENDQEKIKLLQKEVDWLKEQIAGFKRDKFGKKSERWESQEQTCLFNEAEVLSKKPDNAAESESTTEGEIQVGAHTKKRGHRKPLPANLQREVVKVELPPEEQRTEDGTPLKVIGWEISEKLKYEPAKMSVLEIHRAKYGVDSGDYVKTAPSVPSIIPKGLATPELLAAIAVTKYADGLPLYRMEEIFERHSIDLSRTTMARWVVAVAEACQPIWNVLSEKWRESFYVAVDETHLQVLKENGRKAEDKSWMIVRSTPYGPKKIVLFDYSISRGSETMMELISGIKGYLQTDGLNVYDKVGKEDGIVQLGCNMHGRRRFEKAKTEGAPSGKSLGEVGLQFYKELYDLEEEIRQKTPEERYQIRNTRSRPIFEKMKAWVEETKPKVPIKSRIGEAFHYFLNEYDALIGYLQDGRLEMDNGFTERAIRKFAIGRNNWIFSDTEAGAHASSLLYSLVVTAKVNGVNPYAALVKIFTELPKATCIEDYERLADIILSPELTA
jgi:transposase